MSTSSPVVLGVRGKLVSNGANCSVAGESHGRPQISHMEPHQEVQYQHNYTHAAYQLIEIVSTYGKLGPARERICSVLCKTDNCCVIQN